MATAPRTLREQLGAIWSAPPAPVPVPETGYIAGGLKSLNRGLLGIQEQAGQAMEWNADYQASIPQGETLGDTSKLNLMNKVGKVLKDSAEGGKEWLGQPNAGDNFLKKSTFSALESAPPSLAYKAPGFIGAVLGSTVAPVVGTALGAIVGQAPAAAVMYRSAAQEAADGFRKNDPNAAPEKILSAAQKSGNYEWTGEGVSDIVSNVVFSRLPGVQTGFKLAREALVPTAKTFLKNMAITIPSENIGEGFTTWGQTNAANEIMPTNKQIGMKSALIDTFGSTTIMSGILGIGGHAAQSYHGAKIASTLESATASPEERGKAAGQIYGALVEGEKDKLLPAGTADIFAAKATDAIGNLEQTGTAPYALNLRDPALLLPVPPAGSSPAVEGNPVGLPPTGQQGPTLGDLIGRNPDGTPVVTGALTGALAKAAEIPVADITATTEDIQARNDEIQSHHDQTPGIQNKISTADAALASVVAATEKTVADANAEIAKLLSVKAEPGKGKAKRAAISAEKAKIKSAEENVTAATHKRDLAVRDLEAHVAATPQPITQGETNGSVQPVQQEVLGQAPEMSGVRGSNEVAPTLGATPAQTNYEQFAPVQNVMQQGYEEVPGLDGKGGFKAIKKGVVPDGQVQGRDEEEVAPETQAPAIQEAAPPETNPPKPLDESSNQGDTKQTAAKALFNATRLKALTKKLQTAQTPAAKAKAQKALDAHKAVMEAAKPVKITTIRAAGPEIHLNPQQDDILTAIARLGGINLENATKLWGKFPADAANDKRPNSDPARFHKAIFGKPLFHKTSGLTVDAMAELLGEHGYLQRDANGKHDLSAFESRLMDALAGKVVNSDQNEQNRGELHMAEEEARLLAQYEESAEDEQDAVVEIVDSPYDIEDDPFATDEEIQAYREAKANADAQSQSNAGQTGTGVTPESAQNGAGVQENGDNAQGITGEVKTEQTDDAGGWGQDVIATGDKKVVKFGDKPQNGTHVSTGGLLADFTLAPVDGDLFAPAPVPKAATPHPVGREFGYGPAALSSAISRGLLDGPNFYVKGVGVLRHVLEGNSPDIQLFATDETAYGHKVVAIVNGIKHDITKGKIRASDIELYFGKPTVKQYTDAEAKAAGYKWAADGFIRTVPLEFMPKANEWLKGYNQHVAEVEALFAPPSPPAPVTMAEFDAMLEEAMAPAPAPKPAEIKRTFEQDIADLIAAAEEPADESKLTYDMIMGTPMPERNLALAEQQLAKAVDNGEMSVTIKTGLMSSLTDLLHMALQKQGATPDDNRFGSVIKLMSTSNVGDKVYTIVRPYGILTIDSKDNTVSVVRHTGTRSDAKKASAALYISNSDDATILDSMMKDTINNRPEQTLVNELMQNAIDASSGNKKSDGRKITINQNREWGDYSTTVLSVTDNGSGMTEKEVLTKFLGIGEKGKDSKTNLGGYARAKTAFLLMPKSMLLRTTKNGVTTVLVATREEMKASFMDPKKNPLNHSTYPARPGEVGTTVVLTSYGYKDDATTFNTYAVDNRTLSEFIPEYVDKVMIDGLKVEYTNPEGKVANFATKSVGKRPQSYKAVTETIGDNTFTVHFVQDLTPKKKNWNGRYAVDISTLNKGLWLDQIQANNYQLTNVLKEHNFKIYVDFSRTSDVNEIDYPFIQNRTQMDYDIAKAISKIVNEKVDAINQEQYSQDTDDFNAMLRDSPTVSGVKVLIPFKDSKEITATNELITEHRDLFAGIAGIYKSFQRVLQSIGEDPIELAVTLEMKVHGYRAKTEIVKHAIYAINPFSVDKDLLAVPGYAAAVDSGKDPNLIRAANMVHTLVHEYSHNKVGNHSEEFTMHLGLLHSTIGHISLSQLEEQAYDFFAKHEQSLGSITEDISGYGKEGSRFQADNASNKPTQELRLDSYREGGIPDVPGPERQAPVTSDDKAYERMQPILDRMWTDAKGASTDTRTALKDFAGKVVKALGDKAPALKPQIMRFVQDVLNQEANNGQRGSTNLEQDSGSGQPSDQVGEGAVQDGPGSDQRGVGEGVNPTGETRGFVSGPTSIPYGETAFVGEYSDQPVLSGPGSPRLTDGITGDLFGERSGDVSVNGPSPDTASTEAVDKTATRALTLKEKQAAQNAGYNYNIILGDLHNIEQTVPFLLPGQRDDVKFAEDRFALPDGYGVLFTNGTGTGKTYTGLGIIHRMVRQGKRNILIVSPGKTINEAWVKSGRDLNLDITHLADTDDHGRGVVITTYANFRENSAIAKRQWDAIVFDEAQNINSNAAGSATSSQDTMQAITLHPDGARVRAAKLNPDVWKAVDFINEKLQERTLSNETRTALIAQRRPLLDQQNIAIEAAKVEVEDAQGTDKRPRVVFLSATPYAYEKSIQYSNGYLFNWHDGQPHENDSRPYNSGNNYERFMMRHFGYSMRVNRLTAPGANVDSGIMQRQFNSWLKAQGVLSGRMLDSDYDYDRKFVLIESAIGRKIDDGLNWLREHDRMRPVEEIIRQRFDYLTRRYLLEAIKAQAAIPVIKEHLAMGRQVVVFHDYNKGGGTNPFDVTDLRHSSERVSFHNGGQQDSEDLGILIQEFMDARPDLVELPFGKYKSPIEALSAAFPDIMQINGLTPGKQRTKNILDFQADGNDKNLILVQADAGGAGISLHDTTGKHPRVLINLGLPVKPVTAIQQEGRIYRVGQASNAMFRYFNTGTNWERMAFATAIAVKTSGAENLAAGEQARALLDAYIDGFMESDTYKPGHEGEGTGGKERDRAANNALSGWDKAITYYWAKQKGRKNNGRDDFFETPEPVGYKMVEYADVRPGNSVVDPSAGGGAIARFFPENANRKVIEPDIERASKLAMLGFDPNKNELIQGTFEDLHINNKFDAIVMNPPFGTGGKLAMEHLEKAATHLRAGGRIVALIPAGPSMDKRFEKWMNGEETEPIKAAGLINDEKAYIGDTVTVKNPLGFQGPRTGKITKIASSGTISSVWVKFDGLTQQETFSEYSILTVAPTGPRSRKITNGLTLVADIKLPSVTFERAGTAVNTHIVILDKIDSDTPTINRDYSNESTTKDLFARIKDSEIPLRQPVSAIQPAQPAANGQPATPASAGNFTISQFDHTKTGATQYVAALPDRVPSDIYMRTNALAKKHGGYYSPYNRNGAIKGFLFKSEESRNAFLAESESVSGADAQYSRTTTPVKNAHESIASLTAELNQSANVSAMQKAGVLEIVQTSAELPTGVKASGVKGLVTKEGKMYLVADQIEKGQADRVLMHETVHQSLEALRGTDQFNALLKQMETLRNSGNKSVVAAFKLVPADTKAADVTEEALGYLQEINPNHSVVQRLVSMVKAWLFKKGWLSAAKMDNHDMVAIVRSVMKQAGKNATGLQTRRGAMASRTSVKPWPVDFPKSFSHTTVGKVQADPDFAAAKAGDSAAAQRLVDRLTKPERLPELAAKFPGAIVVPVIEEEATGVNMIPYALAEKIASYGLKRKDDILQVSHSKHKNLNAVQRLLTRKVFKGEVVTGGKYILVEDVLTQGGTIHEMYHHIVNNGGEVVAVSSLAFSTAGNVISQKRETTQKLKDRFGERELTRVIRDANISGNIESLTESESQALLAFKSLDSIRNRIAEESRSVSQRILQDHLPEDRPDINDNTKLSITSDAIASVRDSLAGITHQSITKALHPVGLPSRMINGLQSHFPSAVDFATRLLSTPGSEGKRDARNRPAGSISKADFTEVGTERAMNNSDILLDFKGYDGKLPSRPALAPLAPRATLAQRVTNTFTEWHPSDVTTEYGRIEQEVRTKLDAQQQLALDKMQSEGDVMGTVYEDLAAAMKNKRIAAMKPTQAAFDSYRRVRDYIDGPMAAARERAIEKLGEVTGMNKTTVAGTIAAYRGHLGTLSGWMPRKHGEGNYQTNVHHTIKALPFATKPFEFGHTATLPYYAGTAVAKEIRKSARELGLLLHRDYTGAPTVIADDRTAAKIEVNIAKLEKKLAAAKIIETEDMLRDKIAALQEKLGIVSRPSDERIAEFVAESKSFLANIRAEYETAAQALRDGKAAATHKGEKHRIQQELDALGDGQVKVKVYMRLNESEAKASKLKDEVAANLQKHLDHVYHAGEEYVTTQTQVQPLTEGTYGDLNGTAATERLIGDAIKKATDTGAIDNAAAAAVKKALFRSTADALLQRGAGRHQIKRADYLIQGYDQEDTTQIFTDYMSGAAGMLSKALYAQQQFVNYRYAPNDIKAWAERYIKNNLRNMGKADRIGGDARAIATFMYLGFKVSSVLVNATQVWTLGVAELGRRTKQNEIKMIFGAQRDILSNKVTDANEIKFLDDSIWREQEMATAIHEMSGEGQGTTGKVSKFLHTLVGKSLMPFQEMEMLNRKTMALAAYRAFIADGMSNEEAVKNAMDVNQETNFEMSRGNLPEWAHGSIGRTAYALQSFVFNNWNWLYKQATSGEKADIIALLKYSAMITAIGGVSALAGGDEINKLIRRLTGKDYKMAMEVWSRKNAKQFGTAGELMNAAVWHGGMGALGVNISNAMRLNIPLSSWITGENTAGEAAMGIWSGMYDKVTNTMKYASRGQMGRAAEAAAPAFIEAPMKAARLYNEGATTTHGKPIFDEHGKPLRYSGLDAAKRAIGLQPAEQSFRAEATQSMVKTKAYWSERRGNLLDSLRVARGAEARKSVMQDVLKFNKQVRASQAYPAVEVISSTTIRHSTAASKPDKKKQAQLAAAF